MSRITREQMFMDICDILAKRSTCGRGNVGALITSANSIVSTGYNGPPAGEPHCQGDSCVLSHRGGCSRSLHAEANALERIPTSVIDADEPLDLYVSMSPCLVCAGKIIESEAITRVFYRQEYRIRDGIEALIKAGIQVCRITLAGYIVDAETNQFVKTPEID